MKNLKLLLPLFSLVMACGLPEEDFEDSFPADFCAYAETCTSDDAEEDGDPVEATCEEAMAATVTALSGDDTCTYDPAQAQECLDLIDEGDCDDSDTVESTCASVYTGDACNLTISDYL
ncbi:MAG: hypothetical protein AAFV53_04960 [Myxococcota bacterium]